MRRSPLSQFGDANWGLKYLTWGDIEPVKQGEYEFARLRIYASEPEQYDAYVTPECYETLLEYRKSRELSGEKITNKSPVIVSQYDRKKVGTSPRVKAASPKYLRNKLGELWNESGLRESSTKIRYEFKQSHGFRKFFKSGAEKSMKTIYVEMLMGHATGVNASYMKPRPEEVAEEYSKAIPSLTIMTIEKEKVSEEKLLAMSYRAILSQWYTQDELNKLDFSSMSPEKLQLIREKNTESFGLNRNPQKVIPICEVIKYVENGWEFVKELSFSNEAIIGFPK